MFGTTPSGYGSWAWSEGVIVSEGVLVLNRVATRPMRFTRSHIRLVCTALGVLLWSAESPALEERYEDLSASVEVAGVFTLDGPEAILTFDSLSPGETQVLGDGHPRHQITCRSNYGRPWYLKARVVSLTHTGSHRTLPASNLKWRIVESTGSGGPPGGQGFQGFSDQPSLIYVSQGDDLRGREVTLTFQYSLTSPLTALAGTYIGQIIFTMADTP